MADNHNYDDSIRQRSRLIERTNGCDMCFYMSLMSIRLSMRIENWELSQIRWTRLAGDTLLRFCKCIVYLAMVLIKINLSLVWENTRIYKMALAHSTPNAINFIFIPLHYNDADDTLSWRWRGRSRWCCRWLGGQCVKRRMVRWKRAGLLNLNCK